MHVAPRFEAAPDEPALSFATPEHRIDYIHYIPARNRLAAAVLAEHLAERGVVPGPAAR